MTAAQLSLFERAPALPPGLRYQPSLVGEDEERALLAAFERFDFAPFEFRGFIGQRRTVSFGWRYDFDRGGLQRAAPIPPELLGLRGRVSGFADLSASALVHVLVTEYTPGAAIGWHRDRPEFGDVVGVSLASSCTFRLRRKADLGWERVSLPLPPRSAYLLAGPSRTEWEHSIPGVDALRYSVTFRTLREP
jgi:alkylated DNA repair dioxygenase AlkB